LRLLPEPTARLTGEKVYSNISFPKRDKRPYVIMNMVSSLDGKATVRGKASQIGSSTDRTLMRVLRARVDAVMVGAGTLRAEKLRLDVPEDLARDRESRGLKPQPLAIIATTSGDIPLEENLLGFSPDNLLILSSPTASRSHLKAFSSMALVEVVPSETENSHADLTDTLENLKGTYAVDSLLIEGGPALNHSLIHSGLVDELFLTLSPKLLGGEGPGTLSVLYGPLLPSWQTELELISVHLSGSELFLRYETHVVK
jgi:2,5-diamino-6-(ribosylamino)-4(3H)-pyrimidinone 5'-phosphate reductase